MGKVTIDFDDYEGSQYEEYQGDDPTPGWYTFELKKVGYTDESEDSLRWIFEIADGPYAGWPGFVFANFGTTKWKNQETLRAVQGGKETKLSLDFANEKQVAAFIRKAKRVRGKVENRTNNETGETRLSLRKVRPLLEDASTKPAKPEPDEDLDELEGADEAVEGYTEDELADMSLADLKKILKGEFEYNAKQLRSIKDEDAAIDAILAAQEEAEEEAEEPEADEEGEDFDDDFEDGEEEEEEPEPEPEPAPRRRRGTAATKAAPAKKAAAPAQRRSRRG